MVMMDIQGEEANVAPQLLANKTGAPDLLVIGTHSPEIHLKLMKLMPDHGYITLFSAGFGQQRLAPDGSIVAVRKAWPRSGEFVALGQHFTDETLQLPFEKYVLAESRWSPTW